MDTVRPRTIIRKSTDTLSRLISGRVGTSEEDQVNESAFESEQVPRDGVDRCNKEPDC